MRQSDLQNDKIGALNSLSILPSLRSTWPGAKPGHCYFISMRSIVKRLLLSVAAAAALTGFTRQQKTPNPELSASELLALLPEGPTKRQFIIDCTGCHTFHSGIAYPNGKKRTEQQWREAISRMLSFAGPQSRFPVISAHADPDSTARWLAANLPEQIPAAKARTASPEVKEFMFPEPNDLPHDIAVLKDGRVVITGMFTNQMYILDPNSGAFETVAIPVPRANPRAVELDKEGRWWVVLGGPQSIAVYDPVTQTWDTHEVGMYPHSVALDSSGGAWYNGHFTVNPELIGRVDINGKTERFTVPPHPTLGSAPAGPIPYELRAGHDGSIWGSELQGNRIFRFDPHTKTFKAWTMTTSHAGPRRFDVDPRGNVWIPQYGAGNLAMIDPASGKITEITLPLANTAPYVARVDDARSRLWIGTAAGDVAFMYDLRTKRFSTFHLPVTGALVRHMSIDPRTGDVWLAYGASPGIPARVARLRAK
jgi:virginiamycin B lyase